MSQKLSVVSIIMAKGLKRALRPEKFISASERTEFIIGRVQGDLRMRGKTYGFDSIFGFYISITRA